MSGGKAVHWDKWSSGNSQSGAGWTRPVFHGCNYLVRESGGTIMHEGWSGGPLKATVRSYQDGIKVGCTFITNEAVEQLYKWHTSFIRNPDSKTWQE